MMWPEITQLPTDDSRKQPLTLAFPKRSVVQLGGALGLAYARGLSRSGLELFSVNFPRGLRGNLVLLFPFCKGMELRLKAVFLRPQ